MNAVRAKRRTDDRNAMLAKVHMAKKALALDDDSYRDLLARVTSHRSAAECSDAQLHNVLAEFERLGFAARPRRPRRGNARVSGSMVPLVGKIRALWGALDNLGALADGSERTLAAFVKRQAKVDAVEFLTPAGANQVIEALKAWCARVGFEVPAKGLDAKRALLRAQWATLGRLGALRVTSEDALDTYVSTWVSPHATSVNLLDAGQLDRGTDRLGKWIRYAKAPKKDAADE